ncbi:hypothetical protein [Streptomyces sudanensis]|nr:hypothetical protein [Streptomyces sudanensis]MCP9957070.1 hypothetical protein [Streptomyces sudanensis]MCQ0002349.1 hypothetical protein [Streptomyces sudanensis]
MLALRLTLRAHPSLLLRRLLVTAVSAGTGYLLLSVLGYAVAHPERSSAAVLRLAWCALPLTATAYLAVAVARTDPGTRPRPGLSSVGLGPARLAALAAASTAVASALGSALALLSHPYLPGPPDGGVPLPMPAALTLLALAPAASSAAVALALRPGRRTAGPPRPPAGAGTGPGSPAAREPLDGSRAPAGLPWGVALLAAGLALGLYGTRGGGGPVPLPGGVPGSPAPVLAGWALTALGLVVAGPGLAHLCGRLLQAYRPGTARLLAGRALMDESHRVGRPLGVLCAAVSTGIAAGTLYAGADTRPVGPLSGLGAALVLVCAVAALCTAVVESGQHRAGAAAALHRLGAPAALLRSAALLRAAVLVAGFAPLTWLSAALTALPLRP